MFSTMWYNVIISVFFFLLAAKALCKWTHKELSWRVMIVNVWNMHVSAKCRLNKNLTAFFFSGNDLWKCVSFLHICHYPEFGQLRQALTCRVLAEVTKVILYSLEKCTRLLLWPIRMLIHQTRFVAHTTLQMWYVTNFHTVTFPLGSTEKR